MNIFGVGTWEMLVILVGALIIFGPGKLPEVMGQAGRWVRDFRRMTADLTSEFEKTVGDPNEIRRALTGEIDNVKSQVTGTTSTIKRDLKQVSTTVGKTVSGAAKSTTTTKSGSSATKSTTASAGAATKKATTASGGTSAKSSAAAKTVAPVVASKADPLADVLLFEPELDVAPPTAVAARSNGVSRVNGAAARVVTTPSPAPSAPIDGDDPLARARQRRQGARYGGGRPTT